MSMEDLIRSLFTNGDGVNRGEEIKAHRDMFRGTDFTCGCGGNVYPFSKDMGLCSSCKEEQNLSDLEYDHDAEEMPEEMEDFTAEYDAREQAEARRETERLEDEHREALAFDLDDDRMDIDIPRQIPGVTLNGGPVFEEDDEQD